MSCGWYRQNQRTCTQPDLILICLFWSSGMYNYTYNLMHGKNWQQVVFVRDKNQRYVKITIQEGRVMLYLYVVHPYIKSVQFTNGRSGEYYKVRSINY